MLRRKPLHAVSRRRRCSQQVSVIHTNPFNGPFSGTTQVSRYQKGKTNLDFTEARDRVAVASARPYASLHLAPDR